MNMKIKMIDISEIDIVDFFSECFGIIPLFISKDIIDDFLEKNYLEEKLAVLNRFPDVKFIYNDVKPFGRENKKKKKWGQGVERGKRKKQHFRIGNRRKNNTLPSQRFLLKAFQFRHRRKQSLRISMTGI